MRPSSRMRPCSPRVEENLADGLRADRQTVFPTHSRHEHAPRPHLAAAPQHGQHRRFRRRRALAGVFFAPTASHVPPIDSLRFQTPRWISPCPGPHCIGSTTCRRVDPSRRALKLNGLLLASSSRRTLTSSAGLARRNRVTSGASPRVTPFADVATVAGISSNGGHAASSIRRSSRSTLWCATDPDAELRAIGASACSRLDAPSRTRRC